MDEASVCWIFFVLLATWRHLMMNRRVRQRVDLMERRVIELLDVRNLLNKAGNAGHHVAEGSPLCEWWFIAMCALAFMLGRSFWDVYVYDYRHYHFLLSTRTYNYTQAIEANFQRGHFANGMATTFQNLTISVPQLRKELDIPFWLRGLAMAAPCVGAIGFVIFVAHVCIFVFDFKEQNALAVEDNRKRNTNEVPSLHVVGSRVRVCGRPQTGVVVMLDPNDMDGIPYKIRFEPESSSYSSDGCLILLQDMFNVGKAKKESEEDAEEDWFGIAQVESIEEDINPWVADVHEDLALLVIMMPAVFIVMAMRAEIRVVQVMTGSTLAQSQTWEQYELPLMGTYTADLELSAACQYFTVYAFAMLCTKFFHLEQLEKLIVNRENHFFLSVNEMAQGKSEEQRRKLLAPGGQTKDEFLHHFKRKSEQHQSTLSVAGLLGVWGYIFVGLIRSLFGIAIAVMTESRGSPAQRMLVGRLNQAVEQYIQPVFCFSMVLCVLNMIVVLRIDDLKNPAAFGANANIKFIACRLLLILSDGQNNFFTFLAKNGAISIYQGKLAHVSLLMVECFVTVLFNSIMWKQSMRTRSIEAVKAVAMRVAEVRQQALTYRQLWSNEVFLLGVVAPSMTMFAVLAASTATGGGPVEHVPQQSLPVRFFDSVYQIAGPMLAVPLLALRRCVFLPELDFLPSGHDSRFSWLPRDWTVATAVVWLLISALRWVVFLLTHPFNYRFSDHIFLSMSIFAMLEMEIVLGHLAWRRGGRRGGIAVMLCNWALMGMILMDASVTAKFYHTHEAVWLAFGTGFALFVGCTVWWLVMVALAAQNQLQKKEVLAEPLLLIDG
mmetsp:Transcript_20230/g.56094  ORF Transcript_20230/g.56094 Transcript_20230/m.56094 type:complete len:832 (+) Transcript_20230:142-2637(+)